VNDRTAEKYADRIDLTPAAFTKLADLKTGLVEATVKVLK
jgi:expansin (peptidoglycan-binding protein)